MATELERTLAAHVIDAVKALYEADLPQNQLTFQETRKEFEGQITLVTFPMTRYSRKSPEQTGEEIGAFLKKQVAQLAGYNVIKGFLNISLADSYWAGLLKESILSSDFGYFPAKNRKIMVEYSSPNTNKPLHLGHIRNNLLGYSVAEILKANGYDVIKANLVNDRGIHICKSMVAWQRWANGETPETSGIKGDHLVGKYYVVFDQAYKKEIDELKKRGHTEEDAKKNAPLIIEAQAMLQRWEAGDQEIRSLWETMNDWVYEGFDITYKRLGVSFDKYYYESDTYLLGKDLIQEGLNKDVFFRKSDNSVWIDLTEEGLDEKLVLRGDGTAVYMTQDLGTAQLKHDDFGTDESMYVVGNEQDYHFKVLFLILKKLGKPWADGLFHLSYGMVDLPSGKMKSREGTVVDADDLMEEMYNTAKIRTEELGKTAELAEEEKAKLYDMIGMGALKYFLLKVEPKKRLLFDPNESIDFQGHTGPFIQYTHARIRSVLAKGDFSNGVLIELPEVLSVHERDLIMELGKYPEVIEVAAQSFSPAHLANYVYEVAKLYNKFYHEETILKATDETVRNFRLHLSQATADIIARSMKLMGVDVPNRM